MKKLLFSIIACSAMFFGCQKDATPEAGINDELSKGVKGL